MKKCFLTLFISGLFAATFHFAAAAPNVDPIKFTLSTTATHLQLNQEFEIIVKAEYQYVGPNIAFVLKDANSFRLKLIVPEGFVKTGGDYYDYIGVELTRSKPQALFKLKGKLTSSNSNAIFELLRSHRNADSQSIFIAVGRLTFNVEKVEFRNDNSSDAKIAAGTPGFVPYMTIPQLQSETFADTTKVVLIDHNSRVFTYRYDSTSTATDNGITVLTSGSRRYILNSDVVTPRMYGAKGDGLTDDTGAIQEMLNKVQSNTTIDFQEGTYLFTTVALKNKKSIVITSRGATLKGQLVIGSTVSTDPMYEYTATVKDINFDLTGVTGGRAITLANARGIFIDNVMFDQCDVGVYVHPFPPVKGIHVATVYITHSRVGNMQNVAIPVLDRGTNYLLYVDNTIKTPPYTGMGYQAADFHVNENLQVHCRIANVKAFGIDGIQIHGNTFFLSGGLYKSQIKEQNIHIVGTTWTSIIGNHLFEAGYESILMEKSANIVITDNPIAWPGQRDVTRGYGIKLTGGGLLAQPTYTNSNVSNNVITLPTRSGILIDQGNNYVVSSGNEIVSPGNYSHYYGTGIEAMGNPLNVPLIGSVPHYAIENHEDNEGNLFVGNACNEVEYLFPVKESISIYKRSLQYNNISAGGLFGSGSRPVMNLTTGIVDGSNARGIDLQVSSGLSTINSIIGVNKGSLITLHNGSANVTLTYNSTTMILAGEANAVIPFRGTLTLLRQVDGFREVSRTFGYSTPAATETLANKTIVNPLINGIRLALNNATKTADYTLTTSDNMIAFNTSSGPLQAILPDATTVAGQEFTIKKLDSSANPLKITTSTVDNNVTMVLKGSNQAVTLRSNGVGYKISSSNSGTFQYSATASGTGAATISIPHGLGVTPQSAIVQAANAAASGISYVTTDATNINVVYSVAPASGTNNLTYTINYKLP